MSMIIPTVTALHWLPTAHPDASSRPPLTAPRADTVDMTRVLGRQYAQAPTARTGASARRSPR
jgi:hypothetical protein